MAFPDDSPLSRERLREILIEAAPSLPPLGDVSSSRTAAGTTVHPGDVIQQPPQLSESQPPTLSDFWIVLDCYDIDIVCFHPFSGRYIVLPVDILSEGLSEGFRKHHADVINSTDCGAYSSLDV